MGNPLIEPRQITRTIWECQQCYNEFETYQQACECCFNFECDYCGQLFTTEDDAYYCHHEQRHNEDDQ